MGVSPWSFRQFCQLFDVKELSVTPGRLMTETEAGDWESAVAGVFRATRNGGDVVVGEPGYGSYGRLQANIDLGTGRMTLESRGLEGNGAESSIQTRKFLAPVTDGTKAVGATVCSVAYGPMFDKYYVNFGHGEGDVSDFRQWEKKQR